MTWRLRTAMTNPEAALERQTYIVSLLLPVGVKVLAENADAAERAVMSLVWERWAPDAPYSIGFPLEISTVKAESE